MNEYTKELFTSGADLRYWKNQLNSEQESRVMIYEVARIPEPAAFPAVLCYRWLNTSQGMKLIHGWVTYEDFKSQPVAIERVQQKDGSWVERKVPKRPVPQEPMTVVRDIKFD